MVNSFLCMSGSQDKQTTENRCVVRLTTSFWKDERGVYQKKNLKFLKRKCIGYNILDEDCQMVGVEEVISRIINLNSIPDGMYKVVTCNESRDWASNIIDDYDDKLVADDLLQKEIDVKIKKAIKLNTAVKDKLKSKII